VVIGAPLTTEIVGSGVQTILEELVIVAVAALFAAISAERAWAPLGPHWKNKAVSTSKRHHKQHKSIKKPVLVINRGNFCHYHSTDDRPPRADGHIAGPIIGASCKSRLVCS
jgi:hypothetical protein